MTNDFMTVTAATKVPCKSKVGHFDDSIVTDQTVTSGEVTVNELG